jgi:hypothetical protein
MYLKINIIILCIFCLVTWDEVKKKISVLIKPVETELTDVNVLGCHPPWYLWYVTYGT